MPITCKPGSSLNIDWQKCVYIERMPSGEFRFQYTYRRKGEKIPREMFMIEQLPQVLVALQQFKPDPRCQYWWVDLATSTFQYMGEYATRIAADRQVCEQNGPYDLNRYHLLDATGAASILLSSQHLLDSVTTGHRTCASSA